MRHKIGELANELKTIAIFFVAAVIIMKIAYYRENLPEVIRATISIFWLFALPGYAMTLYWKGHLGLIERLAAGTVAALAIISIASYYLGISGLKIQNQTIILPAAIIAVSLFLYLKSSLGGKGPKPQQQTPQ